jgi:hypothetical protein
MFGFLVAITSVLYFGLAVLLVRKYRWSGDTGFLWFFLPLVLLPFLSIPIAVWVEGEVERLMLGEQAHTFPFTQVNLGQITLGKLLTLLNLLQHVVWGALAIIAAWVIRPCHPVRHE